MKKTIISFACLFCTLNISAQTTPDIYNLQHNDINGTARYMGMAGAFGALGGDVSAVKDNPAGLGVYRQSEFVTTLNLLTQNSHATWNAQKAQNDLYKLKFNNLSFVISNKTWANRNEIYTGLQYSNWMFSYNRLKSFDKNMTVKSNETRSSITDFFAGFSHALTEEQLRDLPYNDINIPWLSILAFEGYLINPDENNSGSWKSVLFENEKVVPSYNVTVRGYMDEYSFGWSGNFSNRVFAGATLNIRTLSYLVHSTYAETFGAGGELSLKNYLHTTGGGVNLNIGAIILPTNHLRLSFALQTPTMYDLFDYHNGTVSSKILYDNGSQDYQLTTEDAKLSYMLIDPLKLNAGVAYLLGKKGLISAEYHFSDYSTSKLRDETGNANPFDLENNDTKSMLTASHTVKLGVEFKPVDVFSVRAGFAHITPGTKSETKKQLRLNTTRTDPEFFRYTGTNYFTAGIGYRQSYWYVDFAVMHKREGMEFEPFLTGNSDTKPATINLNNTNILATIGFRF